MRVENFDLPISKFVAGKHFFKLEGEELKRFKSLVTESDLPVNKFAPSLYLWTREGAGI